MEKYPITKLHGHALQVLEYTDGTARLTLDGLLVTDPALREAIGISKDTFDLFFRQYANGKGEPVVFGNPTQAAICVVCLAGYVGAQEREERPA